MTAPGVAGRRTNLCGVWKVLRLATVEWLGRAETNVAMVTWPDAFFISKLVGCCCCCCCCCCCSCCCCCCCCCCSCCCSCCCCCCCCIDCVWVTVCCWGGAGAILVGVLLDADATLRTSVTLPPANLVVLLTARPLFEVSSVVAVVDEPGAALVTLTTLPTLPDVTESLLTTNGWPG